MTIVTAIANEGQSGSILCTAYDLATAYEEKMLILHVISKEEFVAQQKTSVRSTKSHRSLSTRRKSEQRRKWRDYSRKYSENTI